MLPYIYAALLILSPVMAVAKDDVEEDLAPLLERPEEHVYESDKAVRVSVGGTAGVAYNDNIYRSDGNEDGDFIGIFRPGVRIKTDMRPYRLDLQGRVEVGEYLSEAENNYIDTDVKARLTYDITPEAKVYIGGQHQLEHVSIGAFNDTPDTQAATPTDYTYGVVNTGLKLDMPKWIAHLRGGIDFYNYDNTERRDNTLIINDDRDRDEYYMSARGGYKIHDNALFYVQGKYNMREYDKRIDSTLLFSRDSNGVEVITGIKLGEKRDPLYVDLGMGYLQQDYDSSLLPTVSGVALHGNFNWLPNDLWKVKGYLKREVRETTTNNVSGYLQTRLGTEASYQLMSDLRVGGKLRYTQNDFEVNQSTGGTPRTDRIYDAGVFADYNFYDDYVVGGEYSHVSRSSDRANNDYISNLFLLRLGVLY